MAAYLGIAVGALHFAWQVANLDIDDPDSCLMVFRSNNAHGWIVFVGLAGDAILRAIG
jgi:4-hydroxybenzoate polyprenyltransferase